MNLTKKLLGAAALSAFALTAHADLANPTVQFNSGVAHNTPSLTGFAMTGADMSLIEVTAYFRNETSETLVWGQLGLEAGGVESDSGWSLSLDGDSYTASWVLTNNTRSAITRLVINGQPGGVVFDVKSDATYSPNSAFGNVLGHLDDANGPTVNGSNADLPLTATYRNLVKIGGVDYGDLYTTLELSFLDAQGAGGLATQGSWLSFVSDTDGASDPRSVQPEGRVPEPATLLLVGMGFAGLAAARRRRS